jgi:hypothetical protein
LSAGRLAPPVFAAIQMIAAFVLPVLYFKGVFAKPSLAAASGYELAYWLGIPGLCFLALALLALFRWSAAAMWCAAGSGYLAFILPATLLWLTTGENYRGGGANIGVALVALAMPLYLPGFMVTGFFCGAALADRAGGHRA